jgi:hypothetical protein
LLHLFSLPEFRKDMFFCHDIDLFEEFGAIVLHNVP